MFGTGSKAIPSCKTTVVPLVDIVTLGLLGPPARVAKSWVMLYLGPGVYVYSHGNMQLYDWWLILFHIWNRSLPKHFQIMKKHQKHQERIFSNETSTEAQTSNAPRIFARQCRQKQPAPSQTLTRNVKCASQDCIG